MAQERLPLCQILAHKETDQVYNPITKSEGTTPTEKLLASLCERSFLKLWSYPNPFKSDGKELCDLLVVYGEYAFVFFDREKKLNFSDSEVTDVTWKRWVRKVINAQIKTAKGAERYLKSSSPIYLDSKRSIPFPLEINRASLSVYKFIVAHGAKDACKQSSDNNITGSLAISYGRGLVPSDIPYLIYLDKTNPVHILDSESLPIILNQLDTITDFHAYIKEKERAIRKYQSLMYCGEEDLLAHYLLNFDGNTNRHIIGLQSEEFDNIYIEEGAWVNFTGTDTYKNTKIENQISYRWDELLQRTSQNALDRTLTGNALLLQGRNVIFEMAKEPRFKRRALCQHIVKVIQEFPKPSGSGIMRQMTFMTSFYQNHGYVYLQLHAPKPKSEKSEKEYRSIRTSMLEIACGAAKTKYPNMETIIGIVVDAPKYAEGNEEGFLLLDCKSWTKEDEDYYSKLNAEQMFFQSGQQSETRYHVTEFV